MKARPLKWRLAGGIAALALLSTVLVWQLSSALSRQQIETDQNTLLTHIAVRMASQLAHDMDTRARELRFLASQQEIRDPRSSLETKRAVFERMRNAYPYYSWIGITDTEGNIIAGTDGLLVGKSIAQRDWFIYGRENLHFGDAHDAFLLAKLLPKPKWDDLPLRLVDVSLPVHDKEGRFLGVICGHLSLDWAFEARELMLDQLNREQLDLVVLNRDGKVLMGTPQLPSLKVDLASLQTFQGLAQNTRQVGQETWPDGRRYLTASVRETPFGQYQGMGWIIVARKPLDLAMQAADQLSRLILVAGIGSALLFAIALWFIVGRLLHPLQQVAQAAQRIKAHDLTAPLPQPVGNDEVSTLARSLTELVSNLQSTNSELALTARVFEESGQGILICDPQNRIIRVNRAFSRITGYTPAEIVGQTPAILQSGMQDTAFYQAMWQQLARNGQWQGEIWNKHKDGHRYPEWLTIYTLRNAEEHVAYYLAIFDDITEKKNYERRLVHLANYDSLTELPNRHLLQERAAGMLREAAENGHQLALVFIDLDKFKLINDTLGHPAGDTVLIEVARRFAASINPRQLLARWGGDEFVLVMPVSTADEAARQVEQLMQALRRPFLIERESHPLGMSAGIALYPADGESVTELLRCADTAMYQAKQDGRSDYCFFEPRMHLALTQFVQIEQALRQTLAQDGSGLNLLFQPLMDISGQSVLGVEVLPRWQHADLGQITAQRLIRVAEESGQIAALSHWLVHHSLKNIRDLRRALGYDLPFSINLSALQIADKSLPRQLQLACLEYDLPCAELTLEISENSFSANPVDSQEAVQVFKALGFPISLDDFFYGHATLKIIEKIQPAEVKIDPRLLNGLPNDPEAQEIIRLSQKIADSQGMRMVIKGVDQAAQWQALQAMGHFVLQGSLLAPPMDSASLIDFAQRHPPNVTTP